LKITSKQYNVAMKLYEYFNAKFWTARFFYFWTPHFGWTPRLNDAMKWRRLIDLRHTDVCN